MTIQATDDKNRQRLLDLRVELEELEAMSAEARKPAELDQSSVGRLSRMDAMQAAMRYSVGPNNNKAWHASKL